MVVGLTLLLSMPYSADAETFVAMLARNCPNAQTVLKQQRLVAEAEAMMDDDRFARHNEAGPVPWTLSA
jgi:hypothetical protein